MWATTTRWIVLNLLSLSTKRRQRRCLKSARRWFNVLNELRMLYMMITINQDGDVRREKMCRFHRRHHFVFFLPFKSLNPQAMPTICLRIYSFTRISGIIVVEKDLEETVNRIRRRKSLFMFYQMLLYNSIIFLHPLVRIYYPPPIIVAPISGV